MLLNLFNVGLQLLSIEEAGRDRDTCNKKLLRMKMQRKFATHSRYKQTGSKREKEIRKILCNMTPGEQWLSVRPEWLRNPYTNRKLEIDLYSPVLNTAIEVQGEHHFSSRYIGSEEFKKQRKRDAVKRAIIKARGVHYIEVPCERDLCSSDVEAWLAVQLAKLRT